MDNKIVVETVLDFLRHKELSTARCINKMWNRHASSKKVNELATLWEIKNIEHTIHMPEKAHAHFKLPVIKAAKLVIEQYNKKRILPKDAMSRLYVKRLECLLKYMAKRKDFSPIYDESLWSYVPPSIMVSMVGLIILHHNDANEITNLCKVIMSSDSFKYNEAYDKVHNKQGFKNVIYIDKYYDSETKMPRLLVHTEAILRKGDGVAVPILESLRKEFYYNKQNEFADAMYSGISCALQYVCPLEETLVYLLSNCNREYDMKKALDIMVDRHTHNIGGIPTAVKYGADINCLETERSALMRYVELSGKEASHIKVFYDCGADFSISVLIPTAEKYHYTSANCWHASERIPDFVTAILPELLYFDVIDFCLSAFFSCGSTTDAVIKYGGEELLHQSKTRYQKMVYYVMWIMCCGGKDRILSGAVSSLIRNGYTPEKYLDARAQGLIIMNILSCSHDILAAKSIVEMFPVYSGQYNDCLERAREQHEVDVNQHDWLQVIRALEERN
ncbi:hypothetical protein AKO1_005954 [Acrasis kona]|uniref:F-box domain-containing protein n=1 Tax=Acrasis kona TaxID=1008807 RepID=A0AAW2YIS5_9EUKA